MWPGHWDVDKFDDLLLYLHLAAGVIHCLMHQLEVKRQGNYVSPRVLQGIFNYFVERFVSIYSVV